VSDVTIVIPCYDLGEFLADAVESAREQTVSAREIVVVDDGSTDAATLALFDRFEQEGVTVLRCGENRGAPAARNLGIAHARTEYVLCLDADDVLLPGFLSRTVPVLEQRPEVGIVTTWVELFGDAAGIWETTDYEPTTLLWQNCLASASLFRKSCWREVGGYADLAAGQDWDFWLSIVERGWKWTVVEEPLYSYRVRPDSITASADRAAILRGLHERHQDTYRKNWSDAVVEMDAELARLRTQLRAREVELRERDAELLNLRESLREGGDGAGDPADADTYDALAGRVRDVVCSLVPAGARVLVATKGDDVLLRIPGRRGWHFPRADDGGYAGFYPQDSAAAIEHLEALRSAGAEFLVLPATALWWLDHYEDFRRHVEQRYHAVWRHEQTGVVFDVRAELERRGFSVVVCTYNRAQLLRGALESVLAQGYPADRFELIVVDNGSTDATHEVVEDIARAAPVPVTYLVEERRALSHARNFGIARARFEYVAFLDDDAVAHEDWLAALNAVVDERQALVVGGRIEPVFGDGGEPPAWLLERYVKGFFGLDYRDWGKKDRVLRIRSPLYLGGGNSAYAKRLFRHFGGFHTGLGRNGRKQLAAEETYFNLQLERHDVAVYYTADAVIEHRVGAARTTKPRIYRTAYWSGVSDAIVRSLLDGPSSAVRESRRNAREIAQRFHELVRHRGDPANFGRACRIVYLLACFAKSLSLLVRQRVGLDLQRPEPPTWTIERSIAEAQRWPDGPNKARHLHDLLAVARPESRAPILPTGLPAVPREVLRSQYGSLIERIGSIVEAATPAGASVLVVSKGDDALVELQGRRGLHFPQNERGVYAGHYPEDSGAAIAHLEALRAKGAEYLLFPATSLWWLEHYRGLTRYLETRYVKLHDDEICRLYRLEPLPVARQVTLPNSLATGVGVLV
jgi:glycosyltransferase involved in cell wall biosynthesis